MNMTRESATRLVRARLTDEAVIVSLGHPAYDLFAAGDRPEHFYTWGSMGMVSSVALGVALARPDRRVVGLDGDGSLLMNLGSLSTMAIAQPANLTLVVWDNEVYGTTGGQPTATAHGCDLAAVARSLGIERVSTVTTPEDLDREFARTRREPGPAVIVAKVAESIPTEKPPLDCVLLKQRFMEALGAGQGQN
jgi:thiamine pyrophosphate-dependent acetolactate synthase large subunit-like protein